jgi:aspartate kinase
MNADPRYFENASLLNQISYRGIELAFYGAIHPSKTLQLYKKNSFICKVLYQPFIKRTSVSKGVNLEPTYLASSLKEINC